MILVILFVPVWTTLAYLAMPDTQARMRLRATGEALAAYGNELTAISGALNAVTLITGFMMFAATFSGSGFDRRPAMAGYPAPTWSYPRSPLRLWSRLRSPPTPPPSSA